MLKKLALLLVLILPIKLLAQQTMLTGNIFDNNNRANFLEGATVKNLNTQVIVLTDKDGHFAITAKKGDLVSFAMVGYKTDTAYLANLFPKNVFLIQSINTLNQVDVTGTKLSPYLGNVSNPDNKAPVRQVDIDKSRGGVRLNLGYGKMRKERQKVAALEENERNQEEITKRFNADYVKALVKFEGSDADLKNFLALFRPTIQQVKGEDPFNYDYYTAKAYQSWLKLPKDQRRLPPLTKARVN